MSGQEEISFAFRMKKGEGIMRGMDGFIYKNVLATYTHIHALGTKDWVDGIIVTAKAYKKKAYL
jgi:cobyrinic acid a,c-diamide synthase